MYGGVKMDTRMKRLIMILIILALTSHGIAHVPEIEIVKTAPSQVRVNEILQVEIKVRSNLNETVSVVLTERIVFGSPVDTENLVRYRNISHENNETIVQTGNKTTRWLMRDGKCDVGCKADGVCDVDCECSVTEDPDCAAFWFPSSYEGKFSLKSDSEKTITYKINATHIGRFTIPATKATVWTCPFSSIDIIPSINGTKIGEFFSNPVNVLVRCNGNNICEMNKGEYYKNCPEDCKSGSKDGYCDKVYDGKCDPDCKREEDPDCIKAVCGDGECEKGKGENYQNCPQDCPMPAVCGDKICEENESYHSCPEDCKSGSEDGYCDALKDGVCDPDCRKGIDPDCIETFGNDICEPEFGENHLTCPKDCPSGSRDNLCDKIRDGKCDPDCKREEDPDCGGLFQISVLFFLVVLIFIGTLIYLKFIKRRK